MTFLTPALAIAGILAVAIPIIIHLLAKQRRKPIEWAAMRFLIEAFRKHKRRLQLEQLLLLAVRCLIVALLGAALARPILEATGIIAAGGSRAVYLVIDDGMVSGLAGEDGRTSLQRHVRQAVELINTLGPGDAVGLVTAARPARATLTPPSTNHGAVIDLLQSIASKESATDLPGAFEFVRNAVYESKKNQQQTLVYLFSDFRGGSAALESPLPATNVEESNTVRLLASSPAMEAVSNVQIVSIELVRSLILPGADDGSGQVAVRLARSGGELGADVSRVRLIGEGLPALEPKVVQWQPGQSQADVKFMISAGATQLSDALQNRAIGLTATIESDALEADNQRHAVLEVRNQIRVLLIDRRRFGFERTLDQLTAGQWIRRALETGDGDRSPIQIVEAEPAALDVADIRTADVAILPRPDLLTDAGWAALQQFIQRDGLVIITPPSEVNVHQWSERLSKDWKLPMRLALEVVPHAEGLALAEEQPVTELLRLISSDLPDLARPILSQRVLPIQRDAAAATGSQALLLFADGSPMVLAANPEVDETGVQTAGLVVYLAVAPELSWTNLPSKPLMVPLFQEIVRQGLSSIRASQQLQVGEQPTLARGPAARELVGPNDERISIDQSGRPAQALDHAGVYRVQDQSDHSIGKLAVNVDAGAGVTDVQSAAAVASWLNTSGPWSTFDANNVAATLAVDRATSPIAGILLLIVLGLLIIETILARRFSHAYSAEGSDRPSAVGSIVSSDTQAAGRKSRAEIFT